MPSLECAKYNIFQHALAPGYFLTDVSRILLESPMADEFVKESSRRTGNFPDPTVQLLLLGDCFSPYDWLSTGGRDGGHLRVAIT